MFTFTLLEEGNKAHSSDGSHILAVFKEPEKYESVKAELEDISAEVEWLTSIRVSDMDFQIIILVVIGSSLQWLLGLMGKWDSLRHYTSCEILVVGRARGFPQLCELQL